MSSLGRPPDTAADEGASFLEVLRRHIWIPLLCAAIAGFGGIFLAARRPREYTAVALLQVNDPNILQDILANVPKLQQTGGGTGAGLSLSATGLPVQAPLTDIVSGITNYRTAQRAVEFLQLDPFLSPNQVLAATKASVDPNTSLIDVAANSPNPRYAANIANALARGYVDLRRHTDLGQIEDARLKLAGVAAWRARADTGTSGLTPSPKSLTGSIEQLRLAESVWPGTVTLVRPAAPTAMPAGTAPGLIGLIGALLGLAVGIALVGVREATDRRISSVRDLKRAFRAPVLACVPLTRRLESRATLSELEPGEIEPFRLVLARLLNSPDAADSRIVTLVSTPSNRERFAAAWYVAATAAASGARTLLVDAGAGPLSVNAAPLSVDAGVPVSGFPDLRAGATPEMVATEVDVGAGARIDVLLPGARGTGGLLQPGAIAELLAGAEASYDLVVVDAPSVPNHADSVPFVRARPVVAVCRSRDIDREAAEQLRASLEALEAPLIGLVAVGFTHRDRYAPDTAVARRPPDSAVSEQEPAQTAAPGEHPSDQAPPGQGGAETAPTADAQPAGLSAGEGAPRTAQLRHRAARGLVTVGLRTVLIRAMSFVGVIVIAPLLGPSNYGVVAIGLIITVVGKFFADGGLNPGFIGRKERPSEDELQALSAFQLLVTSTMALGVAAVALGHGERGDAITVMAFALVIDALRVPAVIMAERDLDYGLLVRAEVLEALVYTILAIGLVVAGFGVLGVGLATVLRSLTGTGVIVSFADVGLVRPKWNFSLLRATMRFGLFFQAAWFATILRDGGLSVLLAGIAGTAALGAWTLAQRLLMMLTMLFEAAWRVALPGLARLMEAGEPPRELLERGLSFAATGSGFPVVGLVGSAPALVPALFGAKWGATVIVLPWVAGGAMIGVPLATVLGTLLWARGEAEKVVRMAVPAVAVTLALAALLVHPLGALGAAVSYFVGQCVFMAASTYYARDLFGKAAFMHVAVPTLAAAAGGATGWLVAVSIPNEWAGAVGAAAAALLLYATLVITFDRAGMLRVMNVLRQSLRPAAA